MKKRLLSKALAVAMAASCVLGALPSSVAAAGSPPTVSNMKVELLEHAYGINTKEPAFSWAMVDADQDEVQTSYRIVVGKTLADMQAEKYVKDTGWQDSAESGYVKAGLTDILEDNSLYYWSVQVKDRDGHASPLSEPMAFTTAVGGGWESKNSIWVDPSKVQKEESAFKTQGWTDYTVEMDVTIDTVAIGIALRAQDKNNLFFLQMRGDNGKICPHKIINGQVASLNADVDGFSEYLQVGQKVRLKLEVSGQTVTISADKEGKGSFTKLTDITNIPGELTYGSLGFRTGRSESGTVDNIHVYRNGENGQSVTLYEQDFTDGGAEDFPDCQVQDGALKVGLNVLSRMPESAIGAEVPVTPNGNFAFLRKSFEVDHPEQIEKAVVSVTAKSPENTRQYVYNLYMNGQFVGLGPARFGKDPADNSGVLYYDSYDVTEFLQSGENVLGALNYDHADKGFLCQLTAFYKDGTKSVLTNSGADGAGWKALDGTAVFGNGDSIGTGYFRAQAENINASRYPFGWNEPGYADTAWMEPKNNGVIVSDFDLSPYDADPVKRYYAPAASVEKKGDGHYFIDLGKEIVGGLYLDVDSSKSGEMEIRCGEELNSDGSVRWRMRTGNNYRQYWTLKEGKQRLENIGMMTFRYVEILNCPVELTVENVGGVAIRQEFSEEESAFSSSDELLNKIYETMKYSIQATNQNLMVDSQSRERGAYEGDVLVNSLSSYSYEDDYTMSRFSNEYLVTHSTWPAEYKFYTVINAWNDYLYTGNRDSLAEYYELIKKLGSNNLFTGHIDGTGLVNYSNHASSGGNAILVDWPEAERDGYQWGNYNTAFNAIAYGTYDAMAKIAGVLEKTADQQDYREKADALKAGMISKLYDADKGAYRDSEDADHYSQHATAYALAYGIYDSQEMADKLAAFIRSQGAIRTSVFASWFVLEGLYNAGAGQTAMELMLSKGTRSWHHMIEELGATISTEAWDPGNKSNMTFSHPWGSAPGSQIVQGLFGIKPLESGFAKFQIKMQPGGLAQASVKTPTMKGSVEASFTTGTAEHSISASVTIPANTQAVVSLPRKGQKHTILLVDGTVTEAEEDGDFLSVTLGSGVHTLAVPNAGEASLKISDKGKYYVKDTAQVEFNYTAPDGTVSAAEELGTVSYSSDNSRVASINGKSGAITFKNSGKATIRAILVIDRMEISGKVLENLEFHAESTVEVSDGVRVSDIYIDVPDTLTVGSQSDTALVVAYENGETLKDKSVEISSGSPETAEINAKGMLVAKADGEVLLTAEIDKFPVTEDFVYEYQSGKTLHADTFDEADNTFGLEVVDGACFANTGQKVYFNNADALKWTDYIYAGKFKAATNCANMTFRVSDASTYYLWQINVNNNTLKKHIFKTGLGTENYLVLGEVKLENLKAEEYNDFQIVVDGNRFTTYINGQVVDITEEDTLSAGSIGVRNGGSESFYLDDLKVSDLARLVTKTVTVEAAADTAAADQAITGWEKVDRSMYTEESLAVADEAAQQLKILLAENPSSSRAGEIAEKAAALEKAVAALVPQKGEWEVLSSMVAKLETMKEAYYTDESFANLTKALAEAKELLAENPSKLRQAEIDAQIQKLLDAVNGLEPVKASGDNQGGSNNPGGSTNPGGQQPAKNYADLSGLNKQIAAAEKKDVRRYTSASVKTMTQALTMAKSLVTARPEKSLQATVDASAKTLQAAIQQLKKYTVKKAVIKKVKASGKGKAKVQWSRNKDATGYEIQYSTNKKFKKGVKTQKVSKNKTTSATLKKLKAKKTYYVRIRSYKTRSGLKITGAYSKVLKVKIK